MKKKIAVFLGLLTMTAAIAGCGSKDAGTPAGEDAEKPSAISAPYFAKGVYMYYPVDAKDPAMDSFYVFQDEKWGYTANGTDGSGMPFSCEQADGKVKYSYGGNGESEDTFTVESVENRAVTGAFTDGKKLVFVPVDNANPDSFDAVNYMNGAAGADLVYNDANGWSVKYDPSCIEVQGGGPQTSFVYTGECAGTSMLTVSYNVDKNATPAIEDLAKSYGDKAKISERPFPVTGDKNAYWVDADPTAQGPGLYETAVAIDHMDGYLLVEIITHVGGKDEIDIPVSDALAMIIDTYELK